MPDPVLVYRSNVFEVIGVSTPNGDFARLTAGGQLAIAVPWAEFVSMVQAANKKLSLGREPEAPKQGVAGSEDF